MQNTRNSGNEIQMLSSITHWYYWNTALHVIQFANQANIFLHSALSNFYMHIVQSFRPACTKQDIFLSFYTDVTKPKKGI